jgi:hypothetical protein
LIDACINHIYDAKFRGFDLEMTAYMKTNGLPGFEIRYPPYEEMYFRLFGLTHALSMFHIDITMTWIYVAGPGDKFWVRSRLWNGGDGLTNSHDFDYWDPDRVSLQSHDYEITALPAGGGILCVNYRFSLILLIIDE